MSDTLDRSKLSIDIADFRVGQHVVVDTGDGEPRRGVLTDIRMDTPYPGVVTLVDRETVLALPWELMTVPASRSIEDIEAWLDDA